MPDSFGNSAPELFALPRVAPDRIPLHERFHPISPANESEQPRQLFMQIVPFVKRLDQPQRNRLR